MPDEIDEGALRAAVKALMAEGMKREGSSKLTLGTVLATDLARAVVLDYEAAKAGDAGDAGAVAWLHTMHMEGGQTQEIVTLEEDDDQPFGKRGKDYDPTYNVTVQPLYTTPPAPAAPAGVVEALQALPTQIMALDWKARKDWTVEEQAWRHGELQEMIAAALALVTDAKDLGWHPRGSGQNSGEE